VTEHRDQQIHFRESGQLYAADLEDLRSRLDELIAIGKQLLAKLTEL